MSEDPQIEQDLVNGRKIQAIRRYRMATGAGLLDAKNVIEEREKILRQSGRILPARPFGLRLPIAVVLALGVFVFVALMAVMIALFVAGKSLG
jgi:hypothetical protein